MITPQPAAAPPQGLNAILAALGTGGAPVGNLGKLPSPIVPPNAQAMTGGGTPLPLPGAQAPSGQTPSAPMPGQGAVNPLMQELAALGPQGLQMILQALAGQGGMNPGAPPTGAPQMPGA